MRGGNALLFYNLNPGMLPLLRDGRHGTRRCLILTQNREVISGQFHKNWHHPTSLTRRAIMWKNKIRNLTQDYHIETVAKAIRLQSQKHDQS